MVVEMKVVLQQYRGAYDQTVANYRQAVLTAFQQVEDNLAALRIPARVIEEQEAAIESSRRSLQEAEVRYRSGLDPYLNVITAQTALLNNQQNAVTFRAQRMVASVQLIKTLGGDTDRSGGSDRVGQGLPKIRPRPATSILRSRRATARANPAGAVNPTALKMSA